MDNDELRAQIAVLYAENIALRRAAAQREQQISFLEAQLKENAKAKTQLESGAAQGPARQQFIDMQAQYASVIKRTTASFVEEQNALIQQISKMREELNGSVTEMARMRHELDAAQARALAAEERFQRQQEHRQEQLQRVLAEKMDGVSKEELKLDSEVDVLANQLDQERRDKAGLQQALAASQRQIDALMSNIQVLKSQAAQQAEKLRQTTLDYQNQVQAANKAVYELEKDDSRAKALQAQAKAAELESQLIGLKRASSAAQLRQTGDAQAKTSTPQLQMTLQQRRFAASGKITQSSLLYRQAAQATVVAIPPAEMRKDQRQVQRLRSLIQHLDPDRKNQLMRSGVIRDVLEED